MTIDTLTLGLGILGLFLGILGLFTTILIASLGGTVAVLWKIAKIDKDKVSWADCQNTRDHCPCQRELQEIKEKLNK
jgi:hypothetical protein